MRRLDLLACAFVSSALWMTGVRGDPISAMERNVARLAGTRIGAKDVVVVRGRRLEVALRPDRRVIVVTGGGRWGLGMRGFFLGAEGRLSERDRTELARVLRDHAADATEASVDALVREETDAFSRRELTLRRQDPLIETLLARAARVGRRETVLWQGRGGAELRYRPDARMLVGTGWTQHGFSLEARPDGLRVDPGALEELRAFLHDHQRP